MFRENLNLWNEFEKGFDPELVSLIGGSSALKKYSKVVVYACLQGGSISERPLMAKLGAIGLQAYPEDIQRRVAKQYSTHPVAREFDVLSATLRRRYKTLQPGKFLEVYNPTSAHKLVYVPQKKSSGTDEKGATEVNPEHKGDCHTSNMCYIASHILVGGERWLLLLLLETVRRNKIPLIPLLYEHDGIVALIEKGAAVNVLESINKAIPELQKQAGLFPTLCEIKALDF